MKRRSIFPWIIVIILLFLLAALVPHDLYKQLLPGGDQATTAPGIDTDPSAEVARPSNTDDGSFDLANNSVTLIFTSDSQIVLQGEDMSQADIVPRLTGTSDGCSINIETEKGIEVRVILTDLKLDTSDDGIPAIRIDVAENSVVHLELDGTVEVMSGDYSAGIQKHGEGTLVIEDASGKAGILKATGGLGGAGIGSGSRYDCTGITITGGTVIAQGGKYAAGIGGGSHGSAYYIRIRGNAKVNAEGGKYAAGIGGGSYGKGERIYFSGSSVVYATASYTASGIGGGGYGEGKYIFAAEDTKITAIGGMRNSVYCAGANIGNGGSEEEDGVAYSVDLSELFASGNVNGKFGTEYMDAND